ncbi:MAG: glycyl-radical enzyme activating protein [Clostridia bacterium]|nr:glycyl-radical enzyme activating protein [Clostridia bacterium]
MKGTIFDIKEFSIHDGPGGRTTVFLKGCPLRCKWCHNPEGLIKNPQIMKKHNLCVGCKICEKGCNHPECEPFGVCIHSCPNGCLTVSGEEIDSKLLAEKLNRDKAMFEFTKGGITISGGEPMMQSDFVCDLLDKLDGIHTAIQTSGYTDEETYKRVISKFDYVMQDIKLADENEHIKYTGVSNRKIINNIEWLKKSGKEFVFRVPMIPGITDTEENIKAISEITNGHKTEYLQYNAMAGSKYKMLGMKYKL